MLSRFSRMSVPKKDEYIKWTRDLVEACDADTKGGFRETYTHLREHANSVFVVLCELALCGLIVGTLSIANADRPRAIAIVIGIVVGWLLPNVFLWG